MYFEQSLSGLSLIVDIFKNFRIVAAFSWLSIAQGGESSQRCNIFASLRWPTVERQSFNFWLTPIDTEDKRRNGNSRDITFVLLSGPGADR